MKKFLSVILCALFLILPLSACAEEEVYHSVTFYIASERFGIEVFHKKETIKVLDGDVIGDRAYTEGNHSYAWFTSQTGNIEWNIYSDEVRSDMVLYGRR